MAVYKSDCSRWSHDNRPSNWISVGKIDAGDDETIEAIFEEDEIELKDQYIQDILSHFSYNGVEKVVCTTNGLEGYIYRKRVLIPRVHLHRDLSVDHYYRLKDSPRLEKVCD